MNYPEKLKELGKRRGLFFQSQESYGGAAGFYTYGPTGAAVKSNVEELWRQKFAVEEGNMEIDAPTVMREPVFRASGHLDGFDDMIVECPECGTSSRADHLIEDNTEIEEAESFSVERAMELIEENQLECPACGESLSGVQVDDFNLMFETSIGPGSSNPGYLRPETAQGIFVEFPRLKQYARGQMPFGVTQIGRAYRNEISPRNALVRTREFTQAELEMFIDPERNTPNLEKVEDVKLKLYSAKAQEEEDGSVEEMTVKEAVEENVIQSEWVAYYLGVSKQWYKRIGIDMERFRYRQHNSGELAHYAEDCWDAEADVGPEDEQEWLEIAGFAYRGCYDLKKHAEYSKEDYRVFREYEEPRTVTEKTVETDMGVLGPEYGDKAAEIAEKVEEKVEEDPGELENDSVKVRIDGEEFSVSTGDISYEEKEVEKTGERFTPQVAEPSFGVDRTVYSVMIHSMHKDQVSGEERELLKLRPEVAAADVAVLPLMDKDGLGERAREINRELRDIGFSTSYDDSGSIGRRYRRQDEVGTPVCITVDHETLEDGTVTLRDRDSTEQVRVEVGDLQGAIGALHSGASLEDIGEKEE